MANSILTTPVIDQVIEFLNDQSVRLQDEMGVEVISQWIEKLPKLVLAERERCAKVAETYPCDHSDCMHDIAAAIRSGK